MKLTHNTSNDFSFEMNYPRKDSFQRRLVISALENVNLRFEKAVVASNSRGRTTLFTMEMTSIDEKRTWAFSLPFSSFSSFRSKLISLLEHGHGCSGTCPWLWIYITNNFPRRHWFRANRRSVVADRLKELQSFMLNIIQACKDPRNHSCHIANSVIPSAVASFILDEIELDKLASPSNGVSSPLDKQFRYGFSNSSAISSNDFFCESTCCICSSSLCSPASTATMDSESEEEESVLRNSGSQSLTTLKCGHVFHDECIVEHLNIRLCCPECDAQV